MTPAKTASLPADIFAGLYPETDEMAALGCILIAGREVMAPLTLEPGDFYLHRHQWIYEAFQEVASRKGADGHPLPIDALTVARELERVGRLDEAGGQAYLTQLVTVPASAYHAEGYAATVLEMASRRRDILQAQALIAAAYDLGADVVAARADAIRGLTRASRGGGGAEHIGPALRSLYADLERRIENPRDIFGHATGFIDFDELTGGLESKTVMLLAGGPGVRKSAFLGQAGLQLAGFDMATWSAKPGGVPVAIYSLEMPTEQWLRRLVSSASGAPLRSLKTGRVAERFLQPISMVADAMAELPIYISDKPGLTTSALRADLARTVARDGTRVVMVDYLQLLQLSGGRGMSTTERETQISIDLHDMAKEFDVAIIAISRLNKDGLKKISSGGVPDLEDLAGSAQVPYDADYAAVLTLGGENGEPDRVTMTFRKNREGVLDRLELGLRDGMPAFVNLTTRNLDAESRRATHKPTPPPSSWSPDDFDGDPLPMLE